MYLGIDHDDVFNIKIRPSIKIKYETLKKGVCGLFDFMRIIY
jgi:hypothetical protein